MKTRGSSKPSGGPCIVLQILIAEHPPQVAPLAGNDAVVQQCDSKRQKYDRPDCVHNKGDAHIDRAAVKGVLPQGGTILGTTRTNIYGRDDGPALAIQNMKKLGIDALIPIGGEDTLGVAYRLSLDGVSLVGVPKTIDNDLSHTEASIGLDTAVNEVMRAIDRLHPTAEAHDRVMLVEVMGRDAG